MVTIGKLISTGVGAARSTEANVRRLLFDTKENVTKILAGEIKRFFGQIDIQQELTRVLTNLQLEVSATVKITSQDHEGHQALVKGVKVHSMRPLGKLPSGKLSSGRLPFPRAKRGKSLA